MPEKWETATEEFLTPWRRHRQVVGALVCGSYVTGRSTPRSDIDVVIVLAPGSRWRERGNARVRGLLVEYFANPPERCRAYFDEDRERHSRITATMFLTGRVLFDDTGDVQALVRHARRDWRRALPGLRGWAVEGAKYAIWDAVDGALDAAELEAADLPFQYYHAVRLVYEQYARFVGEPVLQADRLFKTYARGGRLEKYLLEDFPDPNFMRLLLRSIRETDRSRMPGRLEQLADHAHAAMGGFEIDGWKLRTKA